MANIPQKTATEETEMVNLFVRIPSDLKTQVDIQAATSRLTIQDLVTNALVAYLAKSKKGS